MITAIAAIIAMISLIGLVIDHLTAPDEEEFWEGGEGAMAMGDEGEMGMPGGGGGTTLEIEMDSAGGGGEDDPWADEEGVGDEGAIGGGGGGGGKSGRKMGKRKKRKRGAGGVRRLRVGSGGSKSRGRKSSPIMTIIMCIFAAILGFMLAMMLGQYINSLKPERRRKVLITSAIVGLAIIVGSGGAMALMASGKNANIQQRDKRDPAGLAGKQAGSQGKPSKKAKARRASQKKKEKKKPGIPAKKKGPFEQFMGDLPEVQKEEKGDVLDKEVLPFTAMMDKMHQQRRMMVRDEGDLDMAGEGEGAGAGLEVGTFSEKGDKEGEEKRAATEEGEGEEKDQPAPPAHDAGQAVAAAGDAGAAADSGAGAVAKAGEKKLVGAAKIKGKGGLKGKAGRSPQPAGKPIRPKVAKKMPVEVKGKAGGKEVIQLKASGGGESGLKETEQADAVEPIQKPRPRRLVRRKRSKSGPLLMAGISFGGGFMSGIILFLVATRREERVRKEGMNGEVLS